MASDLWRIQHCESCESLYLDPRPDQTSLALAYDEYYTHDAEREDVPREGIGRAIWARIHGYLNAKYGFSRQPADRSGAVLFQWLPPLKLKLDYYARHLSPRRYPERGQLLDVGCGNGAFLARAGEMGWDPTGLDPDPKAIAACRRQGLCAFEGSMTALPDGLGQDFAVVTMSHSLEHVPDIVMALDATASLLRPGGTLWIALPNPGSIGSKVFGSAWRELHPPYHLAIPSQRALVQLLKRCGFEDVKLLRRGAHARRVMRESAENARVTGGGGMIARARIAPFLRLVSDIVSTFSPRFGEETVIVARRARR